MNRFGVARVLMVGAGALLLFGMTTPGAAAKWRYTRTGSPTDVAVVPKTGYALMGGGAKQDPAVHFFCDRTTAGDSYSLSAQGGKVTPSGSNHGIY
jgi:hypothetical protein